MQVFAAHAHAASRASERKHSHGMCREFPPILAGGPVRVPPRPAAPQATRSRPSIGRLADPPEGWTTSMTLPPRNSAYGAKNAKSDRVSLRLRRVRSAFTHVKATMDLSLTEG
jgi:hypothetical protein